MSKFTIYNFLILYIGIFWTYNILTISTLIFTPTRCYKYINQENITICSSFIIRKHFFILKNS